MATVQAAKETYGFDDELELVRGEQIRRTNATRGYFQIKGWIDFVLALGMLLVAAPIVFCLIVLIRLTSRGPGLYRQRRVGLNGAVFTMYKLRSMRSDAESGSGPCWAKLGADSRVTRLGYWLRKLHLDELPQLYNVVCGDMSLVGPRPERPEFVRVLGEQVEGYMNRHSVRPGITGLAQVNLPPDTDLGSVRKKIILDQEYIDTASFMMDLQIIGCTFLRVVGVQGALARRWMGIYRTVTIDLDGEAHSSSDFVTPDTVRIPQSELVDECSEDSSKESVSLTVG